MFALYLHRSFFFFALKKFLNIYLYMAFTIFAIYLHLPIIYLRHICKDQICANPFFRPVD